MDYQNLDELKKLRVVDLKERLSKLGKSTSGLKADLVDRLYNALVEKSGQVDLSAAAPSYVQMCTTGNIPAMGEQEPPVVEVTIDTSQFDMGVEEPQIVTMDQYNVMENVPGMNVQMNEQAAYYQRQQEEEQQLRQQQEELWRQQQQHEEQLRQQQEAEAHYRQQEFQRQQELELRRQQEEQELELQRQQEEQELELRRQQEEQLRIQQEEEYRQQQAEEMRRNYEEEMRRQEEAELMRQNELELERQRLEEQRLERQRQLMEIERQKELELERQRQLEEAQKLEMERQRQLEEEALRQKELELEMQRQKERELELQRQRERELEEQKQRERELEEQKQRERELEEQRQRQREMEEHQQKELELQRQREQELEEQKQRERELEEQQQRERELEEQKQRERELEEQKQRERELEEQKQRERELEEQRQRERELEEKKQRERELEEKKQREKELEEQKQRERELEEQKQREKELEDQKQREKELEEQKQRERELEEQKQRERELEEQKQRERELEKQKQRDRELEDQKQRELARQRQREIEEQQQKELELKRQKEQELQRQRELELERQKELEKQIKEAEAEKKRKHEMELQRKREEEDRIHALYEEAQKKEQEEQLRRKEAFRKQQEQDLLDKQKAEEELKQSLEQNETVPEQEKTDSEAPEVNYEQEIGHATSVIQHTNDVEMSASVGENEAIPKGSEAQASNRAGGALESVNNGKNKENHNSEHEDELNDEHEISPKVKLTKSQKRKLKKKRRQVNRRESALQRSSHYDDEDPKADGHEDVEVQYVAEKVELNLADPNYHYFVKIFESFKLVDPEQARREAEEAAAKAKLDAKKEPDLRKKPKDADEEPEFDSKKDEQPKLSKRKLKQLTRLSIAELKQHVSRPDVVEMHDVTAKDPKLLVLLKSTRNTVPVPRHWCFKRKFLQGKRGIEKPPFNLPEFIKKTGIMEMRQALQEKEDQKTLKAKMREKVRPKMGKIDIDYQKLHDAFFKWQTKPKMTIHGDLYYEGKEYETRLKEKKPGELSDDLRTALGMPVGPGSQKTPPPWLIAMQRYGPPPSYPNLKIPGLNSPIPDGCSFGYHAGGWGKPPVDEMGRPLYGDVFGTTSADYQNNLPEEEVDRSHWGELESESESESEVEEEEEEVGEEDDIDKDGLVTPADGGLATPSGLSSVAMGMETPDMIELRKRKIESEMESGENPSLYTVLPEKKPDRLGGVMMGSTHVYDMSAAAKAVRVGHGTDSGVDVALDPSELDMDQATMTARYEQTLREQRSHLEKEDLSDMVAEHTAKQKNKRKRAAGQDMNRGAKKYKDFKF